MKARLGSNDYQKLAQAIVDDFVNDDVPLQESFLKAARDMSLNAHESRRLLEATNVNAHLSLMQKMGGDGHRYVEFETLDPEKLAAELFDNAPEEKTASYHTPEGAPSIFGEDLGLELEDERFAAMKDAVEKVAAQAVPDLDEHIPGKYDGHRAWAAAATLHKTAEELEMQLRQHYIVYEEKVASLRDYMRRVDAMPWDELEKDAMALSDGAAAPVLRKLRDVRGEQTAEPLQKQAHFVITNEAHAKLSDCLEAHAECVKLAKALEWLQRKVG